MTDQELYLATIEDLRRLLSIGDDYSMLRAAALLRQLLCDGTSSLVHRVNRKLRAKFSFRMVRQGIMPVRRENLLSFVALAGISPTDGPFAHLAENVKLDPFLSTVVAGYRDQEFSIKDIIKIAANVFGGVHKGDPTTQQELALAAWREHFRVGSNSVDLAQLRPIVEIVLTGLEPVTRAVSAATPKRPLVRSVPPHLRRKAPE